MTNDLEVVVKYIVFKRCIDIVLCVLLILITMPIVVICALAVSTDGGNPVFRQRRLGKNKKVFQIFKIRTMVLNADMFLDERGMPTSARVTKIGLFLRKYSLDELPQLFNILAGDMSFVGPRPVLEEWKDKFGVEESGRFEVLPGITGLAQVNGRNMIPWSERVRHDLYYAGNLSLKLDVTIVLRTIRMLFLDSQVSSDRNTETMNDL